MASLKRLKPPSRILVWLGLALICVTAAGLLWWATPHGIGIYVDTLSYVTSARGLLAGTGMGRWTGLGTYKPMTHYPPLYALLLAAFSAPGGDILLVARLLSAVGYGLTALLVGALVYRRTAQLFLAWLAAALVAGSGVALRSYSWALSEPVYMVLELAGWLLLDHFFFSQKKRWLVAAAGSLGLSILTRYVGFAAMGAATMLLLLDRRLAVRRRLEHTAILVGLAGTPILVWMLRNWAVSHTLTNRSLAWHPLNLIDWSQLLQAVLSWGIVPQRFVFGHETIMFPLVALGLLALSLAWLWLSRTLHDQSPLLEFSLLLACLAYLVFLAISISWFDTTTPLDNRILIPVYVKFLALACIAAGLLWKRPSPILRIAGVLGIVWLAYFTFSRLDGALLDLRRDGQGYASLQWQKSPTITALRALDTRLIYTNDITAVYFLVGRSSVVIPNASSSETALAEMHSNLRQENTYLVIFRTLTGEFAPLADLMRGLTPVGQWPDGAIYAYP